MNVHTHTHIHTHKYVCIYVIFMKKRQQHCDDCHHYLQEQRR